MTTNSLEKPNDKAHQNIRDIIVYVRERRVIIDSDLARLYGVNTKRLKEQIKRNSERFPDDFMFRLTALEKAELVANCDQLKKLKHSSVLPLAFTEYGAVMAANILNSRVAIEASIMVVRAFIHARQILAEHLDLKRRLDALERKVTRGFEDNEEELNSIRFAIQQLMQTSDLRSKKPIGFSREK